MTVHGVVVATTAKRGRGIEEITEYVQYTDPDTVNTNQYVQYTDPDTVNTNHPFKQCVLLHTDSVEYVTAHCYTCGGEYDNGRHALPYGTGVD